MPADLSLFPHWQKLVDTRSDYRHLWLAGKFPPSGLPRVGEKPKPKKPPTGNPGTELHNLIAHFGVRPIDGCDCKSMVRMMNRMGPRWCRENINPIVNDMLRKAKKRKMLLAGYSRGVIKTLVWTAIKLAERKVKLLAKPKEPDPVKPTKMAGTRKPCGQKRAERKEAKQYFADNAELIELLCRECDFEECRMTICRRQGKCPKYRW